MVRQAKTHYIVHTSIRSWRTLAVGAKRTSAKQERQHSTNDQLDSRTNTHVVDVNVCSGVA